MSEPEIEGQIKPEEPDMKTVLEIVITKDGRIMVKGMINDEILAYGLLHKAKMEIYNYHMSKRPNIVKPNGKGMMEFLRGRRN